MNSSYNSTEDKSLESYEHILFKNLLRLGFKINILGTRYLVKVILFTVQNHLYTNIEDINIDYICSEFLKSNPQINISKRGLKGRLEYAITNINTSKLKENFSSILNIEYEYYLITLRNLVILLLYLFEEYNK